MEKRKGRHLMVGLNQRLYTEYFFQWLLFFLNKHSLTFILIIFVISLDCRRTLLKKSPWHKCFPVTFAKFLRTPFLQNTSSGCFWRAKDECMSVLKDELLNVCSWNLPQIINTYVFLILNLTISLLYSPPLSHIIPYSIDVIFSTLFLQACNIPLNTFPALKT